MVLEQLEAALPEMQVSDPFPDQIVLVGASGSPCPLSVFAKVHRMVSQCLLPPPSSPLLSHLLSAVPYQVVALLSPVVVHPCLLRAHEALSCDPLGLWHKIRWPAEGAQADPITLAQSYSVFMAEQELKPRQVEFNA